MSKMDGMIRILLSLTILSLWYFQIIGGALLIILGIVALIFIVTGFINFCPLYAALKIRTRPKQGKAA